MNYQSELFLIARAVGAKLIAIISTLDSGNTTPKVRLVLSRPHTPLYKKTRTGPVNCCKKLYREVFEPGVLSQDLTGFVVGTPTIWQIVVIVGDQDRRLSIAWPYITVGLKWSSNWIPRP